MLLATLQMLGGLVLLGTAGDVLIRGAVGVALLARISTAVVGLTVVAMGTSLPELAVSMGASSRNAADLAYGNVVGSCVFNIAVILAIVIVIRPISVERRTVRTEYPFMMFVLALGILVSRDRLIDRLEGVFLFALLIGFTVTMIGMSRRDVAADEAAEFDQEIRRSRPLKELDPTRAWLVNIGWISLGAVGLAAGAELLVRGGTTVATMLGISGRIIGLTVAAIGTSLPELAASAAAARRGEAAIALNNVVGSNIFNILGIVGVTSVVFTLPVDPEAIRTDNLAMFAFPAVIFPLIVIRKRLGRSSGALLLAGFVFYMWYILR